VSLCAWTKEVVESLGWSYLVLNEPAAVRNANVRFLAGYRREWLLNQDVLKQSYTQAVVAISCTDLIMLVYNMIRASLLVTVRVQRVRVPA
jgi:hypothetical protein